MLRSITVICIALIGFSCTIPKDARQLKRATKNWRQSPRVLEGYADSPFAGNFFTLRENKKFEITSSGILRSFATGSWTIRQDTIKLAYLDIQQTITHEQNVYIDRKTSTLVFQGEEDAPVFMRLRITYNLLFDKDN